MLNRQLLTIRISRFLGFTKKTASEIFARWTVRPGCDKNLEGGSLEYAIGHIGRLSTPLLRELQPPQAISILGISEELQNILMDIQFKKIFESETLHYWLNDTMCSRYWTLLKLLNRLKKHAVQTIYKKKQKKRPKITGVFSSAVEESSSSATTSTATASLVHTPDNDLLPQAHVTMATAGVILPDHVVLYKGKGVGGLNLQVSEPFIIPSSGDRFSQKLCW